MAVLNSPGSVTVIDDFLDALMDFAVAEAGFTRLSDDTDGAETLFRLSRVGDATTYWGFRFKSSGTGQYAAKDAVASRIMHTAPTDANFDDFGDYGALFPTFMGYYDFAAPFVAYTFYSDGNNVFAILESRDGIFSYLCFGKITPVGTFTAGEYLTCSNAASNGSTWYDFETTNNVTNYFPTHPFSAQVISRNSPSTTVGGCAQMRVGISGTGTNDFVRMGSSNSTTGPALDTVAGTVPPKSKSAFSDTYGGNMNTGLFDNVLERSENTTTQRTPAFPVYIIRQHPTEDASAYIAGHIGGIRSINLTSLAARDLTDENWRVFPVAQRNGIDDAVAMNSGIYGLAFDEN